MKLDILAFAAHPDDAELSCGGTLIKHMQLGKKTAVVDLTKGELGTRGNAQLRLKEAAAASEIMQLSARTNLGLPDGFFVNDKATQLKVVQTIRRYQPDIVLANAVHDRHPDHGRAAQLVSEACFLAGLVKVATTDGGKKQKTWRPKAVYHYIQDRYIKPDIIVDITDTFETKMKAIHAFRSQFHDPKSTEPETPISSPFFLDLLFSRATDFGRLAGVQFGEGFTVERPPGVENLFNLI